MKQGGDRTTAELGFTIVETIIVLAVTSTLLLSAMVLINGRQSRTEFRTGINDMQQRLQQLVNQTESGYYPNEGNFSCSQFTDTDGKLKPKITTGAGAAQGTNGDCVFLGNAVVADAADNSRLGILTLVANRLNAAKQEAGSFSEAFPVALTPDGGYTRVERLPSGLTFVGKGRVVIANGVVRTLNAGQAQYFALASSFSSYDSVGQDLNSGSRQLGLYGYCTAAVTSGVAADSIAAINGASGGSCSTTVSPDPVAYAGYFPLKSFELCFASGGTNQSGLITIGSGAGGLSVSTQIKTGKTCGY